MSVEESVAYGSVGRIIKSASPNCRGNAKWRDVNDIDTLAELTRFHARASTEQGRVPVRRSRRPRIASSTSCRTASRTRLLAEGLRAGSRVGFLDKNSDLFYQLVFGAAKAGAVSVGINWRLAPPEVAYILNDSRAEVLCVGPDFFGLVDADQRRPEAREARSSRCDRATHEWADCSRVARSHRARPIRRYAVAPDDVAIQMYTSGTTGHPKGVQLQHCCFFDLQRLPPNDDMEWNDWSDRDVSLVAMPSFHIGGVGYGVWGLRSGAMNIVVSEFDPGDTLELIETRGISKVFLVPSAIRMVVQHPKAQHTDFQQHQVHHVRRLTDSVGSVAPGRRSLQVRLRSAVRHDRDDAAPRPICRRRTTKWAATSGCVRPASRIRAWN